jgi:hypothetical protein
MTSEEEKYSNTKEIINKLIKTVVEDEKEEKEENYNFNYITALIYSSTFILSYELLIKDYIIFSIILGWSMFGLTTLSNDSLNDNFSSDLVANNFCKNWLMDLIGISSKSFKNMRLRYYLKVNKGDIYDISKEWLLKEWKIVLKESYSDELKAHILRIPFYILISRLRLYHILVIYGTFIYLWTELILISHKSKILRKEINVKKEDKIYDITWDIFPKSYLCNILMGNLNLNATHLININKTRDDLIKESKETKNKRYKSIESLSELWKLYTDKLNKEKNE